MSMQEILEKKLNEAFKPVILRVLNESPNHNVPEGSESHFRVIIVSSEFKDVSLVKRHQRVHKILEEELQKIHAFSQQTLTPEEFVEKGGVLPSSPDCVKKN